MDPEPQPPVMEQPPARPKFRWWLFFAVIFTTTLLTIVAAQARMRDLTPAVAAIGGGLSALVAGSMIGWRLGRSDPARIALSVLFIGVFAVACVTMNCVG